MRILRRKSPASSFCCCLFEAVLGRCKITHLPGCGRLHVRVFSFSRKLFTKQPSNGSGLWVLWGVGFACTMGANKYWPAAVRGCYRAVCLVCAPHVLNCVCKL